MTRKDYIRLAAIVKSAKCSPNIVNFADKTYTGVLVSGLVEWLSEGHPQFNEERFREATE